MGVADLNFLRIKISEGCVYNIYKGYLLNSLLRSQTTTPEEKSEPSSEYVFKSVVGDTERGCIITSSRSRAELFTDSLWQRFGVSSK